MHYRKLGKTGYSVSALGFGAMRLPMVGEGKDERVDRDLAIPMIHRAFEGGVNYIDSAVGYCNQDSQRAVGEALVGWRDKVIVSTKNPYYGEDEKQWWRNLEDSLRRLRVDCIDIYNHHGINWKHYTEDVEPRVGKWIRKALDQGLIKHICCSFHDSNDALRRLIDSGYPESITLQYNLLYRDLEDGIAYAAEKGVGVVVMGPVMGGRLGASSDVIESFLPEVKRVPELALRFVLSNPNVSVALSGMSTMQHVEENLSVAESEAALSGDDMQIVNEQLARLKNMADLYCTGCDYCMPCPNDVAIAKVFQRYNTGRVYGLWDVARQEYARLGTVDWDKGAKADECTECGDCEGKCPQNLEIVKELKEAHRKLGA